MATSIHVYGGRKLERLTATFIQGELPMDEYQLLTAINSPSFDWKKYSEHMAKRKIVQGISLVVQGLKQLI